MALARIKTFVAGEVLTAADLNAELDNPLNNALSLISPLLGNLDVDGNDLLDTDEFEFRNAAADATAVGRLRRNAANLMWHDGTAARQVALRSDTLAVFAATTSAQLAGVISDETGSGALVFGTSPTLAGTIAGTPAASGTWAFNAGLTTAAQAALRLDPFGAAAGNTGELRFLELAANGTNYTGFKAADSLTGSVIWTLPSADGSANQVVQTNGSGVLSFAAAGATGFTVVNTSFSNASGNVAVTGAGFTPKAVHIYASDPDDRLRYSEGWASSTSARAMWSHRSATVGVYSTILVYRVGDGTDELSGDLVSLDSDGATFQRIVAGAGQAVDVTIIFFR